METNKIQAALDFVNGDILHHEVIGKEKNYFTPIPYQIDVTIKEVLQDALNPWKPINENTVLYLDVLVSGKSLSANKGRYVCVAFNKEDGFYYTDLGKLHNQPDLFTHLPNPPEKTKDTETAI